MWSPVVSLQLETTCSRHEQRLFTFHSEARHHVWVTTMYQQILLVDSHGSGPEPCIEKQQSHCIQGSMLPVLKLWIKRSQSASTVALADIAMQTASLVCLESRAPTQRLTGVLGTLATLKTGTGM